MRYSGEIPEIAFNSAVHHLTRAEDGPGLSLSNEQIDRLKSAALERYREIVLRDLIHENHLQPMYRGVKRSIANYQRFCCFCGRQEVTVDTVQKEAAQLFPLFLENELSEVGKTGRDSIINCTFTELKQFAIDLNVVFSGALREVELLCQS